MYAPKVLKLISVQEMDCFIIGLGNWKEEIACF